MRHERAHGRWLSTHIYALGGRSEAVVASGGVGGGQPSGPNQVCRLCWWGVLVFAPEHPRQSVFLECRVERLRRLLPTETVRRGGRWRDHRQVINGVIWRTGAGRPWRTCPSGTRPGRSATGR